MACGENMTNNIPVFITARMGSTRFPGKHMYPLYGKPSIQQMIDRIKSAKLPSFYVICTTTNIEDGIFRDIAYQCKTRLFRGHPTDILQRWLDAADWFKVDSFISAEADDIFCDPEYIDKCIRVMRTQKPEYLACKGLPFGTTPTGIQVKALREICDNKTEMDTEGQERFFKNKQYIEIKDKGLQHKTARMTLDYPEDLAFFNAVYAHMGGDTFFSLREIIELLRDHPEIVEINRGRQEEWKQRYEEKYGR